MREEPHRTERQRPRRPWAYTLHSLLGLKLSLLLCFVCLTGTVAVVSHEIDWLLRPEVRADVRAKSGGDPVSWGRQLAAAREAFPDHSIVFIEAGKEPYLATVFEAIDPAGDLRQIFVDPGTGQVTGEADWLSLPGFVRALHYHLFTDRTGGWMFYTITSLGFVLLGSVVTGLLVYKRFWRGFVRLPRRERGSRVFWGGLHRLAGLWVVPFAVLVAVTSVWYLVEWALEERGVHFETYPSPLAAAELPVPRLRAPERLPLDHLVGIARREIPEMTIERIWLPSAADEPLYVTGRGTAALVRSRADGVELDPYSGAVRRVHRARDMGLVERWSHTADPLHFGDFAGWWSKVAWVGFGLLLSFSAWSGVLVYLRRIAKGPSPPVHAEQGRARFLGPIQWGTILVLTLVPVLFYTFSWRPSLDPAPSGANLLGPADVGPWSVEVRGPEHADLVPGAAARWNVRFCEGCWEQVVRGWIAYGDASGPAETVALNGNPKGLGASLSLPPEPRGDLYLWLGVETWSGERHTRSWRLEP